MNTGMAHKLNFIRIGLNHAGTVQLEPQTIELAAGRQVVVASADGGVCVTVPGVIVRRRTTGLQIDTASGLAA
jgi:hypothetical protein